MMWRQSRAERCAMLHAFGSQGPSQWSSVLSSISSERLGHCKEDSVGLCGATSDSHLALCSSAVGPLPIGNAPRPTLLHTNSRL